MDLQTALEIAGAAIAFLGSAVGVLGAVWVFFRRRIRQWWDPYRQGLQGAAELPELRCEVEKIGKSMYLLTAHVRAQGDTDIERGQFEADATGANTYVNLTYARWLGVGKAELSGWGWVNFVHPDDRIRVRKEWDACRAEHRVYNVRYRMLDADGEDFEVDALATPIPESPPAKRWLGVIRKVVD